MEKQPKINPFENDIVSEPRRIEKAVAGLNDKPLEAVLQQFELLENGRQSGKGKLVHAQFAVSPQPGYGKSHLIGRLFRKLNQRATLVYLRPFEDASACWRSVLLKMVQELDFPDRMEAEYSDGKEPTQLEAFAHGIFVYLIADAIERGTIPAKSKTTAAQGFREITIKRARKHGKWVDWIRKNYNELLKQCSQQIKRNGIHLYASHLSWLNVLFTYAYFPSEFELRETCKDWLQGGSIDPDEAKEIGIRSKDISHPEMSGSEMNEVCKHRILDFCQLAGFFRPFVFCFDQTENYGKEIVLAKAFGSVIQVLMDESCNQMTVVTANQAPWTKSIEPWWEDAHRNRLSPPIELEGLKREQAVDLIEQRFKGWDIEEEKIRFTDNDNCLDQLFSDVNELGVRDFLHRCRNRWQVLIIETPPDPPVLSEYYRKAVEEVKTQPKRLVFDPNTLYWLVNEVAAGLPDITVEKYKSQKGYFTLLWKSEDRQLFFGFESGSNSRRWQAIAREAEIHHSANHGTKIVFFRTPEQPEIPGQRWKKIGPIIEKAKQQYLHIIRLKKSEIPDLYAAYDLYVDAGEENIPFERHEVLEFIREHLKSFWERIMRPLSPDAGKDDIIPEPAGEVTEEVIREIREIPEPAGEVTEEVIREIREIVEQNKFMSVDDLMKKLSTPVPEELLHEARAHIPEIKVHVGPNMTVLLWQSDQSM